MTTGYDLWDPQVWSFFIALAVLFIAVLVANALVRLIKPLRHALIPAPVLGGFLLLLFLFVWRKVTGSELIAPSVLELLTYHGLGLGCAALALKTPKKDKNAHAQREIFNSALVTTSTYLLQAVIGLAISFGLSLVIKECWAASGILMPMGYGQGPGQAYNWGHTYETSWGFANGTSFGLTISSMGFVACSIGGVLYLNIMRRKKNPKVMNRIAASDVVDELSIEDVAGKNEIPLSDSMDKLTAQFGLTCLVYFVAFALTSGLSYLCDLSGVKLLTGTVKPLFWGFNFIFATLGGVLVRSAMGSLKKKGIIKREYTNNMMLDRVSGLMFDLMIVASIAAIDLSAFTHPEFILPLSIMCIACAVGSYLYVDHVCRKLFPSYSEESFLALYGMLTGVVGTGVILLREIDPKFETRACTNLVFQTLWTCLMGFPLLLLMGFVAQNTMWLLITLGVCTVMLIFFYSMIRLNSRKIKA